MKVGTDGTLLGAWAALPHRGRILDIGTGTGLIAIMAAQRSPEAQITAIDIDAECVEQARLNANASPWAERIEVIHCPLQEFMPDLRFDSIISNPPYFVESLLSPDASRSTARHTTSLSFHDLAIGAKRLLAPQGRLSLILPPVEMSRMLSELRGEMFVWRECEVWSTPTSGVKRVMVELRAELPSQAAEHSKIIIEDGGPQSYSEEYRALTRDFYLKF